MRPGFDGAQNIVPLLLSQNKNYDHLAHLNPMPGPTKLGGDTKYTEN